MSFLRRAWEALLATQRPAPVHARMSKEEVEAAVRAALAERGGVQPEERIYSEARSERGQVVWDVQVRLPEATRGGHRHLHIDDATGEVVKVFEVPY
jgi:hypothetical protein